jgi:hypothetical protein
LVDRIAGAIPAIINEEECAVAAIVYLRYTQGAANGQAVSFLPRSNLSGIASGKIVRPRVESRVGVIFGRIEANPVGSLLRKPCQAEDRLHAAASRTSLTAISSAASTASTAASRTTAKATTPETAAAEAAGSCGATGSAGPSANPARPATNKYITASVTLPGDPASTNSAWRLDKHAASRKLRYGSTRGQVSVAWANKRALRKAACRIITASHRTGHEERVGSRSLSQCFRTGFRRASADLRAFGFCVLVVAGAI